MLASLWTSPLGWLCHMVWVAFVLYLFFVFVRYLWRRWNKPTPPS